MIKQTLSQKMLQKLSPQQIQLMKLLQIPTATLEQRIKEELEANPTLEEGADREEEFDSASEEDGQQEDYELDDYLTEYMEDDPSSYRQSSSTYSAEDDNKTIPIAVEDSLHDHLERQIGLLKLNDPEAESIALQIVGSIDDDGYLRREPSAIIDDLMFAQNIFVKEADILKMLKRIQAFDPPGIGARDLKECLLIQLTQKIEREEYKGVEQLFLLTQAKKLIEKYFNAFTKKHFDKLQQSLGVDEEELKDILEEIIKLNPKPASGFSSGIRRSIQYVVPDFIINNRDGELELTLNSRNAPDLRINERYQDMLRAYQRSDRKKSRENKEALTFIKQKIDSARWFIDAIQQRQQTMYRSMYAILQYQHDYFLTGDEKRLKPMILKDIADVTGLDISTISRVANSKFVQTEFGTKRLKDFFSESLQTDSGEDVSTREVKKILEELVAAENKRKPLSDEKLKNMLTEKGYNIARRTVAKYREQLNIPVARLRKEL